MQTPALPQIDDQVKSDTKDVQKGITNRKFKTLIDNSLRDRSDFEKKVAKFNFQRFGRDRPKTNNRPWPGASNYRRKKADEIIEQKKAFFSQIIHSSQYLANFKALVPSNTQYAGLAEAYFDYIIKEFTEFEIEMIYALDSGLEAGSGFVQVIWDEEKQIPKFKWIDNLYLIFPSRTLNINDASWIVNVIQMSKDEALDKYGNIAGFRQMLTGAMVGEQSGKDNDSGDLDEDRYARKGINMSMSTRFVVWDIHYRDPNDPKLLRQRTICPDDFAFDFKDDRAYPYTKADGSQEYMFKHFRREWLTPDIYSSRGVPEIVWEEELMLTHLARLKHNYMTFVVNPVFTSPNGLSTTSTNNVAFAPGYVLPGDLQPIQFPSPPISMDQETQNVESVVDRRMNTSNATGTGPSTIYNGGQNGKTARQVSFEASLQGLAVNYETMSWKKFMRQVLRYAWELMIQPDHKPESLSFYMQNTLQQVPADALNKDYNLVLSWSVDNINREFNIQQARVLWQDSMTMQNPSLAEKTWKNYVQQIAPGESQEFELNPEALQQDQSEAIAGDIDKMVSTGFPVRPKESTDHYLAVGMTVQFIQNEQNAGRPIFPDRKYLLDRYIIAHRDMLRKTNPQQYEQLNQQLNAMDIASKQQAMQKQAGNAEALKNQLTGMHAQQMARGVQPQNPSVPSVTNGQPQQPMTI